MAYVDWYGLGIVLCEKHSPVIDPSDLTKEAVKGELCDWCYDHRNLRLMHSQTPDWQASLDRKKKHV